MRMATRKRKRKRKRVGGGGAAATGESLSKRTQGGFGASLLSVRMYQRMSATRMACA
jgi:hypothetical protein